MKNQNLRRILTWIIATVWLANGLVCKILNLVPRHQQIVAEILGQQYSRVFTLLIGVSELIMAVWVVSRYKSKINAVMQIVVVATMNVLEYLLVPDLLLWGKMNSLFAILFIFIVWYNEFVLHERA